MTVKGEKKDFHSEINFTLVKKKISTQKPLCALSVTHTGPDPTNCSVSADTQWVYLQVCIYCAVTKITMQ